ncbi:MAG: protocatechuate 3,4-dioxygenase beta subunit [Myxococcota bacterium]|jgi:protocatechuate 3,4-dioxygenase beta subunit
MNSGKTNSLALVSVAIFAIAAAVFMLMGNSEPAAPQPIEATVPEAGAKPEVSAAEQLNGADVEPERINIERTTDLSGNVVDDMFADQAGSAVSGKIIDADGKAVPGAAITLNQRYNPGELMRGYTASERFKTTSDRNGEFVFVGLAAGINMNIWVYHPDFAPKQAAPFASLINETQTLAPIVLSSGYEITGIVRDRGGNPLEAFVELRMQPTDAFRKGTAEEMRAEDVLAGRIVAVLANAEGKFGVNKLAEGIWVLRASYEGFATVEIQPLMLLNNKAPDEQKVVLSDEFTIAGTVLDEQQMPIANAKVNVARTSPRPTLTGSAITDEDGRFTVYGLQEGDYGLSVQADGYTNGRSGRVSAGTTDIEVVMQVKGSVSGRVSDLNGQALTDFQIEVLRTRRGNQQYGLTGQRYRFSDADGTFNLPNLSPGSYILLGRADNHSPTYSASFHVGRTKVSGIDIILKAGGIIEGIIVDGVGKTIGGAMITVHGQDFSLESTNTLFGSALGDPNNMPMIKTRSNAQGEFILNNVPDGRLSLEISHDEHLSGLVSTVSVGGSTNDLGNITIYAGGSIQGIAKDKDGKPLAGGTVTISTRGGSFFHRAVTLDTKGRYRISGLDAGSYTILAAAATNDALFLFPSEADKKTVYINVGQDLELNLQTSE